MEPTHKLPWYAGYVKVRDAGYRKRDEIARLPNGEYVAFLKEGMLHGPHKTEGEAEACCNGVCDCWKKREEMKEKRKALG